MIRIVKQNESIIERGYRLLKTFGRSKADVSTSYMVSSWGDDSQPIIGSDMVHSETATDDTVILGVINKSNIAKVGEKRIYSTDDSGNVVVAIYLKNDGTIEIAGNSDNAVKYSELNNSITGLVNDINTEFNKISLAIAAVGGAYTVTPITIDLSSAKNETIKTN